MAQTIYTQITHEEGKCSGCINVYYEAGDDRITATCNQCGADLLKRLAAPSVSEEQPWPKENQVMKQEPPILAPHRATIALIPHCGDEEDCGLFYIEVDGVRLVAENGGNFLETEEIAKAKMESLRGENHGGI